MNDGVNREIWSFNFSVLILSTDWNADQQARLNFLSFFSADSYEAHRSSDFNWKDCRPTNGQKDNSKHSQVGNLSARSALLACCLQTIMKLQLLRAITFFDWNADQQAQLNSWDSCLQTVMKLIDTSGLNWWDCRPTNRQTHNFKSFPTSKSVCKISPLSMLSADNYEASTSPY